MSGYVGAGIRRRRRAESDADADAEDRNRGEARGPTELAESLELEACLDRVGD